MEIDDAETWVASNHAANRDDFSRKYSRAEYSEYNAHFGDAPHPVKSQAYMIVTQVEEQLNASQKKFNEVRDKFHYISDLYGNFGMTSSEINDSDRPGINHKVEIDYTREIETNYTFSDDENFGNLQASGDTHQYYDSFTRTENTQPKSQDEFVSPEQSATSHRFSPRRDVISEIQDEDSNDSGDQNCIFEEARSGDFNFDSELLENPSPVDDSEDRREYEIEDITPALQHPYQLQIAEYSKNIEDEWEEEPHEAEELAFPEDRATDSIDRLGTATKREVKKHELFLNLSGSAESVQTTKNKKSKPEKHRKAGSVTSSSRKSAKPRHERKKFVKIENTTSRSTTAKKDARDKEIKRATKKRKQRGHATMPASASESFQPREITTEIPQNRSEMVEIFHNPDLGSGSISVVSSKHSRSAIGSRGAGKTKNCDRRSAIKGGRKLADTPDRKKRNRDTNEARSPKIQKNNQRVGEEGSRDRTKICDQTLNDAIDLRSGGANGAKVIFQPESTKAEDDEKMIEENNDHQHRNRRSANNHFSSFCDPFAIPRYELPTVASTMKRVNRSYFNRFNFRNIPFVVGTSVTPSYNLGLNIQETLSLMKTRQIMSGDATPFLISRVNKGMRPVSTVLECIRNGDETPAEEGSLRFGANPGAMCNVYSGQMVTGNNNFAATSMQLGPFTLPTPKLSCIPNTQSFHEAQQCCGNARPNDSSAKKHKTRSICSSMKFIPRGNVDGHPELTQSALLRQRQEELNLGNSLSTKWPSVSQNGKGIRDVLVNFHDQFEAMQLKYEKLQEQSEKSDDKSLLKEISELENDLTAKEEEINAVVSLYQEVMTLKQQMRMLHERNSLVCVTTECHGSPMLPEISARAHTASPVRMINLCGRNGSVMNNRGPSTSTRLAGLLRQIKIFQKQLKLDS